MTVSSVTPDRQRQQRATATRRSAAGDRSPHHEDQRRPRVVAGLPMTYTITVTNARAERRDRRHGDRRVPGGADRRDMDVRGHRRRRLPSAGSGHINTAVTVPVGATVAFTATGTVVPRPPANSSTRPGAPAPGPRQPQLREHHRLRCHRHRGRPGDHEDGTGLDGRRATVVYTITVTNTGPSDAAGVVVSDATPTGLVFVSNTGDCTTAFPCTLGAVPAGRHADDHGDVHRSARLQWPVADRERDQSVVHDVRPEDANNTATAQTTLNRNADVEVTKTVPRPSVPVGDKIPITINAINHGPNPATGIEVTDRLPAGFDFVSASASQGAYDPATGAWSVGALAVSETGATGPDGDSDSARGDHEPRREDGPERARPEHEQRLCGGTHHQRRRRPTSRSSRTSIAATRWSARP